MSSAPANISSPPSPLSDPRYSGLAGLPGHVGSLLASLDGVILAKCGELDDDKKARVAFLLVRDAARLAQMDAPGGKEGVFELMTVEGADGSVYGATVSEERVYIVKRRN